MGKLAGKIISKESFKGMIDGFIKGIDEVLETETHGYAHNMYGVIYAGGVQNSYMTIGLYRKDLPEIIFTSDLEDVKYDPLLIAINASVTEALEMDPQDHLEFVSDFITGMGSRFNGQLEYNDTPTKDFLEGRGMDFRMYLEQRDPEAIKRVEFLEVIRCSKPDTP